MRQVDDPLMTPEVPDDPHDQAAIGRFDFELIRLRVQPRHPHLVMVAAINHLRIAMSDRGRSAPARNQQIVKKRVEDAFEIMEAAENIRS